MIKCGENTRTGRRATRTVTAPNILSTIDCQRLINKNNKNCSGYRNDYLSTGHSGGRSRQLSGNHSCMIKRERSLPGTSREQRSESNYCLRECRRQIIIDKTNLSDKSDKITRTEFRKISRCWSRERITQSEVVLCIKPPPEKQDFDNKLVKNASQSKFDSLKNEVYPHSSNSKPESVRYVPLKTVPNRSGISSAQLLCHGNVKPIKVEHVQSISSINDEHILNKWNQQNQSMTDLTGKSLLLGTDGENLTIDKIRSVSQDIIFNNRNNATMEQKFTYDQTDSKRQNKSIEDIYHNNNNINESEDSDELYSTAESASPVRDETDHEIEKEKKSFNSTTIINNRNNQNKIIELCDKKCETHDISIKRDKFGYGFTIFGCKPVVVHNIRINGVAEKAGLKIGDQLIKVNENPVSVVPHDVVASYIRSKPEVHLFVNRHLVPEQYEIYKKSSLSPMPKECCQDQCTFEILTNDKAIQMTTPTNGDSLNKDLSKFNQHTMQSINQSSLSPNERLIIEQKYIVCE